MHDASAQAYISFLVWRIKGAPGPRMGDGACSLSRNNVKRWCAECFSPASEIRVHWKNPGVRILSYRAMIGCLTGRFADRKHKQTHYPVLFQLDTSTRINLRIVSIYIARISGFLTCAAVNVAGNKVHIYTAGHGWGIFNFEIISWVLGQCPRNAKSHTYLSSYRMRRSSCDLS